MPTGRWWRAIARHGGPRQRVVAYLGEMDEAGRIGVQQAAQPMAEQAGLFAAVKPEWVEVDLKRVRVECARQFGGAWLGYELLQRLELIPFLTEQLALGREEIPWATMAIVLVLGRWCDPSSELQSKKSIVLSWTVLKRSVHSNR